MNFPSVGSYSLAKAMGIPYNTLNNPSIIVNSVYSIGASGARKIVLLSNGWLVVGAYKSGSGAGIQLYVSKDNGISWSPLCYQNNTPNDGFALATKGTTVYLITPYGSDRVRYVTFNATTVTNTDIDTTGINIDSSLQSMGSASTTLFYNAGDNTLHAAWSSETATYPSSFNIRYLKGTVNADNSVTWGAVEQVTTLNSTSPAYSQTSPCLVINAAGYPVIITSGVTGSDGKNSIRCCYKNASGWNVNSGYGNTVYALSGYDQKNPFALFVPQSINGLANGRIWVSWGGIDAANGATNLMVCYSDDGGVTWSAMQKLTTVTSDAQQFPTMTADAANNIFILFQGLDSAINTTDYQVRQIKNSGGTWGAIETLTNIGNTSGGNRFPGVLHDPAFSSVLKYPPVIFDDSQAGAVRFRGVNTLQQVLIPPEIYVPLWWYSGSMSSSNTTGTSGQNSLAKGTTAPTVVGATPSTRLHTLNSNWPANTKYALEATVFTNGYSGTVELWDKTTGTPVTASQITTSTSYATIFRSGTFTLTPGHDYAVVFWAGSSSGTLYVLDASLIVFPS